MYIIFRFLSVRRKGGLSKADDYIEIGDETYSECVEKVLNCLNCEWDSEDEDGCEVAQICRVNGTKVLDKPLVVQDQEVPWTISAYVRQTFHKQSQVKLGIGMFEVKYYDIVILCLR